MTQDREGLWAAFFSRQQLTEIQQAHFRIYYEQLVATNKLHNITAITDLAQVITDHFEDSLALRNAIEYSSLKGLGDIGTGAGFPGLPLKLIFPDLPLVLIEVNAKKRAFLQHLVRLFQLRGVVIEGLDWRTFLRQTHYDIDLFCARASLQPEELVRVYKPTSPYKEARLVYWASRTWQPSAPVQGYVQSSYEYQVGSKQRRLIFLSPAQRAG